MAKKYHPDKVNTADEAIKKAQKKSLNRFKWPTNKFKKKDQ